MAVRTSFRTYVRHLHKSTSFQGLVCVHKTANYLFWSIVKKGIFKSQHGAMWRIIKTLLVKNICGRFLPFRFPQRHDHQYTFNCALSTDSQFYAASGSLEKEMVVYSLVSKLDMIF